MQRQVWKFPLALGQPTKVSVPPSSKLVMAAPDPRTGGPALWFELPTMGANADRLFVVYGTGHPIDDTADVHVGSMIDPNGFVWHVYERP